MRKRKQAEDDFDSPWKDALQAYLPAFLAFFFPDIFAEIDWSRGYQSLDKEFQQIVRHAKVGKRLADKLFKVWLKDGGETWLIIHVEIQGDVELRFPERMFDYNAAAHKLYNQEVIGLAVLCDDDPAWRPERFSYGRWGCRMELTFRISKLLDFAADMAALESDSNPFAAIVLAHLQAARTRNDPEARRASKFRLVKGLYKGNFSKEDVRRLFGLIDWLMTLPNDLEEAFRIDVHQWEEEHKVEYMSSIERYGFKKGSEQALLEGIETVLEVKFGTPGRTLFQAIRSTGDPRDLRKILRFLKKAKSVDEVRAFVSRAFA